MLMLCRSEDNWEDYDWDWEGISKAAVNCYTIELGRRYLATQEPTIFRNQLYFVLDREFKILLNPKLLRFPKITSTSCSPGFIETDLTRGFVARSSKTPQQMGMLTVEMVTA